MLIITDSTTTENGISTLRHLPSVSLSITIMIISARGTSTNPSFRTSSIINFLIYGRPPVLTTAVPRFDIINESILARVTVSGIASSIKAVIDAEVISEEKTIPSANLLPEIDSLSFLIPTLSEGIFRISLSATIDPSSLMMLLAVNGEVRLEIPDILDKALSILRINSRFSLFSIQLSVNSMITISCIPNSFSILSVSILDCIEEGT